MSRYNIPSQNPALTIIAQALRVADHIASADLRSSSRALI